MTINALTRAIKKRKPAIVRENGAPRFVVLDWNVYRTWEQTREDTEDNIRFELAERESRGKKRYSLAEVKKKHRLK